MTPTTRAGRRFRDELRSVEWGDEHGRAIRAIEDEARAQVRPHLQEVADLTSERDALRAEVERLREALTQIEYEVDAWERDLETMFPIANYPNSWTRDHLQRLRAVLAATANLSPGDAPAVTPQSEAER